MLKEQHILYENLILIRCIITGESKEYFKGKDYQGNNYLILKNNNSLGYYIGKDITFHAYKEQKGVFFKKVILNPLSNSEYIKLIDDRGEAGKTLKEIGMKLHNISSDS